jgi:hypothetical protein
VAALIELQDLRGGYVDLVEFVREERHHRIALADRRCASA